MRVYWLPKQQDSDTVIVGSVSSLANEGSLKQKIKETRLNICHCDFFCTSVIFLIEVVVGMLA